jgi:hypothetical protein
MITQKCLAKTQRQAKDLKKYCNGSWRILELKTTETKIRATLVGSLAALDL